MVDMASIPLSNAQTSGEAGQVFALYFLGLKLHPPPLPPVLGGRCVAADAEATTPPLTHHSPHSREHSNCMVGRPTHGCCPGAIRARHAYFNRRFIRRDIPLGRSYRSVDLRPLDLMAARHHECEKVLARRLTAASAGIQHLALSTRRDFGSSACTTPRGTSRGGRDELARAREALWKPWN